MLQSQPNRSTYFATDIIVVQHCEQPSFQAYSLHVYRASVNVTYVCMTNYRILIVREKYNYFINCI